MAAEMVTCARCATVLPANQADFSADGMLCRRCVIDAEVSSRLGVRVAGAHAIAAAERGLLRSKAIKHLSIGVLMLVAGIAALAFLGWAGAVSPRALVMGVGFVIGGCAEVGRGLTGLVTLPALPPADPEAIATAYVVKR